MKLSKQGLALLIVIFISQFTFANQETLQQGWAAFNKNQLPEAKKLFQQASNSNDTKTEALLALSLVNWANEENEDGFKNFTSFTAVSDNSAPYLYGLWSSAIVFDGYGKKSDTQLALLNSLTRDGNNNSTLAAMANSLLAKHYEAEGNFKEAAVYYAKLGTINDWQIVGTFDNTSGSGFNKDFGVLANPKEDAVFKNKVNADVKWFKPPHVRSDRWFDFNYYFSIGNSIMYAQTFLNSPAEQEVYFRSGNSGSLKIWVNEKLVTNISEERNCDMDIYINNVKLNKGFNRVLVQIGESETDNANFMIRVTDKEGKNISSLTYNTSYQPYTKAAEYNITTSTFFAEEFFEKKIAASPNSLINYIILAEVYLRNDKVYEARKTLKKAKELAPESTFISTRMIEAYARDKNVTDLTKEYEKIKAKDPNSKYAIKGLIDEANEKEDFDEKEKLLNRYIELHGKNEYTDILELNLVANRKQYDKIAGMAASLYAKYPDNFDIMSLNYQLEVSTNKNLKKGNQFLSDYLKRNYNDRVLQTLASNYFKLGKKEDAIKIYKQRIENVPYSIGFYGDLSDIYFEQQEYENALVYVEKQLEFAPYIGGYWYDQAKIKKALGKEDEAKTALQKAIYYTPTNYDARKELREINKQKDLFENFEKSDAYEIFKNSKPASAYPDDNSVILHYEIQRVVYPEGATEEKTEVLIKVFNQNGIDTWKEYSIGYNSYRQRLIIDKAEIFKKDGNKVQAEKDDDYIVFTNLEADDAIHLSYRIENYNTGKLAAHFWEQFSFNYTFPSELTRYSLLIPSSKPFKFEMMNGTIKEKVKDIDDMKLYVWEAGSQKAIEPEPFMPPLTDVGTTLDISTLPDWQFVSNWYADLSGQLAKSDYEIKETVAELFKDKKNLTELQKAKVIYEFIEANVSYSSVSFMHGPIIPQRASRTLNTKLGDCKDVATLFVAMCKEVGLKANLILVDTRDNGEKHLNLPSIDFNHCIAKLYAGGLDYYVELTDQRLSFSSLPPSDLNANALFIPRDGDEPAKALMKLNTAHRVTNSVLRDTKLRFENNDMTFDRTSKKTGALASYMRGDFADVGKEKQERSITQAVASDFTNPTKLLSLSFGDLKALSDTLTYDYSFQVKNELTEVVGIKICRLPWSEGFRSLDFLSLEKRDFPFLLWTLRSEESNREVMTIQLPKDKALAEMPKNVVLSCPSADYSMTYTTPSPGVLKAVREFKRKKDIVPVAEYEAFREFFNKVAESDMKQIGFK